MRILTIKRTKSFVACLGTMKVYIEDATAGEITIGGVPCRMLGTLKNGQEQSFEISENAAKVFVIADRLSKDFCNEFYQLPEGDTDVYLSGKNKYNPITGNPFQFDNNDDPMVLENRKRNKKKGGWIMVAAVIVGLVIGFAISSGLFSGQKTYEPKTFTSHGMTITLTEDFYEDETENYTVSFYAKHTSVAVLAFEESFSEWPEMEQYTAEEYAEMSMEVNEVKNAQVKTENGLVMFEYDSVNENDGNHFRFFAYVYKTDDAFWMVQFAVLEEDADDYAQQIAEWAKTVKFD